MGPTQHDHTQKTGSFKSPVFFSIGYGFLANDKARETAVARCLQIPPDFDRASPAFAERVNLPPEISTQREKTVPS